MRLAHYKFYYSLVTVVIAAFFSVPAQQQTLKITDLPFCHLGKTLLGVFAAPAKLLSLIKSVGHSTVVSKHW